MIRGMRKRIMPPEYNNTFRDYEENPLTLEEREELEREMVEKIGWLD